MAASTLSEADEQTNWFTRTFSPKKATTLRSPSSTSRLSSVTNPAFVSFSDLLRPRRTTEHPPKQPSTIDETLVDIAVNARSDISSLADKSRGTIDFFHTPPVS
jgi:hypothetical protein